MHLIHNILLNISSLSLLISDGRVLNIKIDQNLKPEIVGYQLVQGPDGVFVGEITEELTHQTNYPLLLDDSMIPNGRISPGISGVDNFLTPIRSSSVQNECVNVGAGGTDMLQGCSLLILQCFVKPKSMS